MKNPYTTHWILEKEEVNIKLLDDDGNNLVLLLLQNFTLDEYSVSELKYLIERKGCDVDITNKNLQNAVLLGLQVKLPVIETNKLENNISIRVKKAERKEQKDKNLAL